MANSKWYKLVIPHTNLKIHPHTYPPLQVLKNSIQISNNRNLPSYLIKRPFQFIKPLIVPRIANSLILSIISPSKFIKIEIFHFPCHHPYSMNLPKILTIFRIHICRQKIQKIIPLITPLLTPITFTSIVPFLLNSSHFSFAAHSFLDHILSRTCFIISKTELQTPIKSSKYLLPF